MKNDHCEREAKESEGKDEDVLVFCVRMERKDSRLISRV